MWDSDHQEREEEEEEEEVSDGREELASAVCSQDPINPGAAGTRNRSEDR